MKNFKTVDQAKRRIEALQDFVDLAESNEPKTIEEQIIKYYAYVGSTEKVANKLNEKVIRMTGNHS